MQNNQMMHHLKPKTVFEVSLIFLACCILQDRIQGQRFQNNALTKKKKVIVVQEIAKQRQQRNKHPHTS